MTNTNKNYTKQAQLAKQLKEYIIEQELQPGEKLPSERRLFEIYGMSRVTVRIALKILEKENVVDIVRGKGSFVKERPLDQSRSITFVLAAKESIADVADSRRDDPGKTFLLKGFSTAGRSKPIHINFCYLHPDEIPLDEALTILNATGSDGFLFAESSGYAELIQVLSESGKVCVARSFQPLDIKGAYTLWADLSTEFYAATLRLLNAGRKKIVYVGFDFPYDMLKLEGIKKAIRNAGLDDQCLERIILSDNYSFRAYVEVEKYFRSEQSVDTDLLICCNDDMAIAALAALKKIGIQVPSKVAVFGSDNIVECAKQKPQLSSISYPFYEMGMKVYDIFNNAFSGNPIPPGPTAFACDFISRSST